MNDITHSVALQDHCDKQFIDGSWVSCAGSQTIQIINPANETTIATVRLGNRADVDLAVEAARRAFPAWSRTPSATRARYLRDIAAQIRDRAESLARLSSLNNGKPLAEARLDITDAVATYEYYAGLSDKLDDQQAQPAQLGSSEFSSHAYLEPVGVVALIVPWNFPLVTTAWKLAPALAAGCTVVLKPSEVTPLVEMEMATIALAVGLPAGVFNLVNGAGEEVGAALVEHPHVAKVSFTGSNRVGERVMQSAARRIANVSLELGGKSPIIVFENANLDRAVELVLNGIFFNAGQMCSATSRLLVQESIAPQLLERLKRATEAIVVDDAFADGVTMGPLTSATQLRTVMRYLELGRAQGLNCLSGGKRIDRPGYFVTPTIFVDVPTNSELWTEEIFGPVLCTRTFKTEEEAIRLANDTPYGLAATIVHADDRRAERVARALEAGHIWINGPQVVLPQTSWGGFKRSGLGRELGPWGLQSFLEIKQVTRMNA